MKLFRIIFGALSVIIIAFGFYFNQFIPSLLALFFLLGIFTVLREVILHKTITNHVSFPYRYNKKLTIHLGVLLFEYLIVVLPALFYYLFDDSDDYDFIILLIEAVMYVIFVFFSAKYHWLVFSEASLIQFVDSEITIPWDKIHRFEFNTGQVKVFFDRKNVIIINLEDFSEEAAKAIRQLLESKANTSQYTQKMHKPHQNLR